MKQRILSRVIRPLTSKRGFLFNKQVMKCMTVIMFLIGCYYSNQVQAQNAVMTVTVLPAVSNSTHWIYNIRVSAGQGYITNDNDFGQVNPNGSWRLLKLVFTTSDANSTPIPINSGMTFSNLNNPTADIIAFIQPADSDNFESYGGTYVPSGSGNCSAVTEAAAKITFSRLPPGPVPDANAAPRIIGKIGLKKTTFPGAVAPVINLRGAQADSACNFYVSAWSNGLLGTALPVNFTSVPLPIHLIRLNGTLLDDCTTHLNWEVANSDRFSNFEVEYKGDNGDFSTIKTVAYDASNNGRYQFDYHSPRGNGYYRLKMTDIDGSSSYSNIIFMINNCKEKADSILVYPNQVQAGQKITLEYKSTHQGTGVIWLTNTSGVQYKLQTTKVVEGKNSYDMHLPRLANGLYYIKMAAMDKSWETPMQKIYIGQ